jgi:hypothetical protein
VDLSGVFFVQLTDNNGCSGASAFENITVYALPTPIITRHGDTLITNHYSHYQWLHSSNPITNDTNQTIIVTANGCYKVSVVDSNGCTGISDSICFSTGINEIAGNEGISIYPNPSNGTFIITINSQLSILNSQLRITDVMGQIISEANDKTLSNNNSIEIDLSHEPSGIYFLEITFGNKTFNRKLIKI